MVKLPGTSADRPNVYPFGTTYEAIAADLRQKDASYYTQNGLLMMMERNRRLKLAPQRFQDSNLLSGYSEKSSTQAADVVHSGYDLIITCEERCFDLVCEDLVQRGISQRNRPVHVLNFDIKDTPEDAMVGARSILTFVQSLEECVDLDDEFDSRLATFMASKACIHPMQHAVLFY